jgi:hypothetical protein
MTMEKIELRGLVDRRGWAPGPWDDEPDKVEWRDIATGAPCIAIRNLYLGFWCGYVAVPPGHPWHGLPPDDVHPGTLREINFTGACDPDTWPEPRLCHTPQPGEPAQVWWIGFDCGYARDYAPSESLIRHPGLDESARRRGGHLICRPYRSLAYVTVECAAIARAIVAAAA